MGFYKASIRYIDLLQGSYSGNYPPENVLDINTESTTLDRIPGPSLYPQVGVYGPKLTLTPKQFGVEWRVDGGSW